MKQKYYFIPDFSESCLNFTAQSVSCHAGNEVNLQHFKVSHWSLLSKHLTPATPTSLPLGLHWVKIGMENSQEEQGCDSQVGKTAERARHVAEVMKTQEAVTFGTL